jgi:hypothetical protein
MDCFAAIFVFGTIDTRIFSMSFMYRDLIQLEVPLIIMKKSKNGDCSEYLVFFLHGIMHCRGGIPTKDNFI